MREFMHLRISPMINNLEALQKLGKHNVETAIKMCGEWNKGWRTISVEMTDFTKRSIEDGVATVEKLLWAKSVDQAVGIQSDFTAPTFDGYFHNLLKIGGMYAQLLKDSCRPLEQVLQTSTQQK